MKGLIAYDSYYGNGAQVAAAIAEELRAAGHEVTLLDLHHEKADKQVVAQSEFLVLGGPTRMKHMSRRALSFAKKLDATTWAGRSALVYDTYGPLNADPAKNEGNAWLYPGGVAELRERLVERSLSLAPIELRCLVDGTKGPRRRGPSMRRVPLHEASPRPCRVPPKPALSSREHQPHDRRPPRMAGMTCERPSTASVCGLPGIVAPHAADLKARRASCRSRRRVSARRMRSGPWPTRVASRS